MGEVVELAVQCVQYVPRAVCNTVCEEEDNGFAMFA